MSKKHYPGNVSDAQWSFVAPAWGLMKEDALQREYDLRAVFNGLRFIVRSGLLWRYMLNDWPPWKTVFQQAKRWEQAGVFEQMAHDLSEVSSGLVQHATSLLNHCTPCQPQCVGP